MKQITRLTMIIAAILGLATQSANAVFIDNGNSVLDADTNLQWLKLSYTDNMSANSALAAYQADGWSISTELQYETMFDHYFTGYVQNVATGYMVTANGTSLANQAAAFDGLFGLTLSSSNAFASYALYSDANGNLRLGGTYTSLSGGTTHIHRDNTIIYNTYWTAAHINSGIFMVKALPQPEPEPLQVSEASSLLLLGLGLAGLGFTRRRV